MLVYQKVILKCLGKPPLIMLFLQVLTEKCEINKRYGC